MKKDSSKSIELHFFLLFINIINIVFHASGGWVLYTMYKRAQSRRVERMLIINLSVVEFLTNLLEIVRIVPDVMRTCNEDILYELVNIMLIISFTGLYIIMYATMIYITVDRLLHIRLNIRYKILVTQARCKRVLIITWVCTLILCVGEIVYYHEIRFNWEDILFLYIYPPFQIFFLGLAVTAYSLIFHAYKQAKNHRPGTLPKIRLRRQSSFELFRKSRFVVFMLLITTFALFMIIPDVTYVVMAKIYDIHSDILVTSCMICYACSNLCDAFIYIFAGARVRKKWMEKMRSLCCCCCFADTTTNINGGGSRGWDIGDRRVTKGSGGGVNCSVSCASGRVCGGDEGDVGGGGVSSGGNGSGANTSNQIDGESLDQTASVQSPHRKRSHFAPTRFNRI